MSVGGILGMNNINLPFAEIGILVSVIVLGVLILADVRLPMLVSSVLVGVFALCHGHAHGAELPAAASGVTYAIGFALTTVILHLSGISFGAVVNKVASEKIVKLSGAMIALMGLFLSYIYFVQ